MGSKRISSFSIILAFTVLSFAGVCFIPLLPIKLSPSLAFREINVRFTMRENLSPRVVEMEVTSKLEAMLSRMKDIEQIESRSRNGGGNIIIRMNKHADMEIARFEVSTIIRQAWPSLPPETNYPEISVRRPDENASRPFIAYTINSPANPILIQQFTESQIQPRLNQIEGISRINISGAQPMEWQLTYDNIQLLQLGVAPNEIQNAIYRFLEKIYLGTASIHTEEGSQWLRVMVTPGYGSSPSSRKGDANDPASSDPLPKRVGDSPFGIFDVSKIQVKKMDGKLINLDQIVKVAYVERRPTNYFRINGLNSIYLSITADGHANQLELSKKIKNQLAELESIFPAGYEIHLAYDATDYIQKELNKVYFRSSLTLIILLLFVLLIYRNLRYLLLISISLAVNIAIALIGYYFLKLEIQLYSLAGITISLTLIIDNTIVMSDQIIQRRNMKAFVAILTATLTSIAALGIIFFLDEQIRLNLQDFAVVIIVNLSISLFIALFLVPALLEKLKIKKRIKIKRIKKSKIQLFSYSIIQLFVKFRGNRKIVYFNRFYERFCFFTWRWRVPVVVLIVLAFGLPVFLLPEKIKIDETNEGNRWVELYNQTIGSAVYKEKVKPVVDKALGG
ncbi:MAG: efflux RND transporter permease subunit, partial [Tannerella sp.]|nr:efflux RND transporter permease subunit [Tannerella sp.]